MVVVNCCFSPTVSLALAGDTTTCATGAGGGGGGGDPEPTQPIGCVLITMLSK